MATNSWIRIVFGVAALAAAALGVILVTAPSGPSRALGVDEPELRHVATAFGVAVLLAVAALLLRPERGGVRYHAVRFHGDVDVARPRPPSSRPKLAQKVRKQVRDQAAARVRAAAPRPPAR